ncbi:hypothetical protein V7O62_11135 [Methanolobus sp. ZRKC2]|uniref:hypothetical protein n=1 Tax=Methanolobus sp. ZRKC2 TaxID=3125783 RepID=UPI00324E338C
MSSCISSVPLSPENCLLLPEQNASKALDGLSLDVYLMEMRIKKLEKFVKGVYGLYFAGEAFSLLYPFQVLEELKIKHLYENYVIQEIEVVCKKLEKKGVLEKISSDFGSTYSYKDAE